MGIVQKVEVDIGEDQAAEVQQAIASGEFATLDEVVQYALDAWWHQRMTTPENSARLRRLWEEGLASGEPVEVTDAWFEDIKRRGREHVEAMRGKS